MKLLLDTHCLLWWFSRPEKLSEHAIKQIANEDNELWFSVASIWEMSIKVAIGKLPLPDPINDYVPSCMTELGTLPMQISVAHAFQVATLPMHHRDPFDRMIISQAQLEGMTVVSSDSVFQNYEVDLLRADR